ncbi:MAG: SpoIIE family protein phosphatase [Phycisphaerae bacterium]|nr:SpoIIE family protein phosphatase [Phycisphaerae bacterium]
MKSEKAHKRQRQVPVPTAMLTIAGPERVDEVLLDSRGVVIGRNQKCDVVLKSERVSRRHARVFQDPFGRWIIEDLGSGNGVLVHGERITAHAILPGEKIGIGQYVLTLTPAMTGQIAPDPSIVKASTTLLAENADLDVIHEGATPPAPLSRIWLQELNRIVDRLGRLGDKSELYPEVCRCLASAPGTAALVVRLPGSAEPLPISPEVVACHVGGGAEVTAAQGVTELHLSRRVLEAIRRSGQPVMARSAHSADEEFALTIDDERAPRAVLCAPVSDLRESVDALYLDVPADDEARDVFEFLQVVARQVQLVRKVLLFGELNAERRVLDHQLAQARKIQARLTPSEPPSLPGVDVALHYEPAMWVGGDYCDVWTMPDRRLAFVVADVSGKGLGAAMVMANLQAALRTAAAFCTCPTATIAHVNTHLDHCSTEEVFVTLFFGIYDTASGRLEYVNAGHIPPLVLTAAGEIEPFDMPADRVLGVAEATFTTETRTLAPGAGLVLVTDGITEACSPDNEQFGTERLGTAMRGAGDQSARQLVTSVTNAAARHRDHGPPQDDVTVFALVRSGVDFDRAPI